jgi:hypothetical protein
LVKSFEQLNDVNLILIQKNEFENLFSNGLLLKYCILMDKYKKDFKKYPILNDMCLSGSKYDFLAIVINENINCDELLNNSVILKYPIFFTLVLKTQNTSKNCGLNNHLANEASSFIKELSSNRYIFYEV